MKRMKMWTSLMLAVLMVLSMFPISAAAETETQSIPNVGLGDWYVPDWTDKIVLTDEGDALAFTYDRSQVQWVYFAAPVTADVGAGGILSFTMDFGAERGYADNFLVRMVYADGSTSDLWPAAQEGKAVYTLTVPLDAASAVTEVCIYPENPYNSYESQTVTVKLYEASLSVNTDTTGVGSWYVPDWISSVTMTDEGEYLSITYDRSEVSWAYIAAPATVAGVGAGGAFSFTLDFGEERGYTDSFLVRLAYADGSTSDLWPAAQEGKAVYTVDIPMDVTSTVTEVQIYPENPYNSYESQTVTVKLYDASLKGYISNVGLGKWYVPDWTDKLTMADEGKYLDFTYDRSQVSWVYFAAPAVTEDIGGGSTFSFTMDFGEERGYTDSFLVRLMYADDSFSDLWPAIQEGKAEYTVTVPKEATSTVKEVHIYPENPYESYESRIVTVRLYQAKLSVTPLVYEGLNQTYYPSWWGEEGSWANDPINISTENPAYMLLSYESRSASAAGWRCVVAEPSITASAGATLTFDLEFEPERTGENFLVRFFSDNGEGDVYVGITAKRATYTITVPDSVQGTVSEIRIHPENPWSTDLPEEASAMKLYSVVFAAKEAPGKIAGHSLTLNDNVSVNFYLDLNDSFLQSEGAALKVTVDDTTTSLPIPEANENGQYVFGVEVAAAQMTAPVTVQLVSNDMTGEAWSYSVLEYANEILSGSYSDATKALVRAMLDYGGKAQSYFSYRTDAFANAGLTDLPNNTMPDVSGYDVNISGSVTGLNLYSASLLFKSRVAIRYYFTLSGDNAITDYRFTVGSQECTPVQNDNGLFYVEVSDITPLLMETGYTVTVAKADGTQSLQVTYSCMSYITRMYAKQTSSETLKELLKAMYEYSLAAKSYQDSL